MLGGLSVPLTWGTVVPPDDYDHWAKDAEDNAEVDLVPGAVDTESVVAAAEDEWDEWAAWREWQAENAEPRFEMPRSSNVVPHSPAAG